MDKNVDGEGDAHPASPQPPSAGALQVLIESLQNEMVPLTPRAMQAFEVFARQATAASSDVTDGADAIATLANQLALERAAGRERESAIRDLINQLALQRAAGRERERAIRELIGAVPASTAPDGSDTLPVPVEVVAELVDKYKWPSPETGQEVFDQYGFANEVARFVLRQARQSDTLQAHTTEKLSRATVILRFARWLADDEAQYGCRGLSRLEVDQMRDAWLACAESGLKLNKGEPLSSSDYTSEDR